MFSCNFGKYRFPINCVEASENDALPLREILMERKKIFFSAVMGVIGLAIGLTIAIKHPISNLDTEIRLIESAIEHHCSDIGKMFEYKYKNGKPSQITVPGLSWELIEDITKNLTYTNKRIAIAKILTYHSENPIPPYSQFSDLWHERYFVSKEPWKKETIVTRIFNVSCIGILLGILSFITFYSLTFLVPWLWYFFLDRLKEFSLTIQGKNLK